MKIARKLIDIDYKTLPLFLWVFFWGFFSEFFSIERSIISKKKKRSVNTILFATKPLQVMKKIIFCSDY